MVGAIIATHGKLAEGLLDSIKLIMGEQSDFHVLSLCHGDDIELFREKIKEKVIEISDGDGVIIFVDLFFASPYNQAARIYPEVKEYPYRLITGVNLPMLVDFITLRNSDISLDELAQHVMEAGKDGIKEFFKEISNK